MNEVTRQFRDFFVSLKLTVVLLALGIVLIFWATLDQTDLGVWGVQHKFFHSLFVLVTIPGTQVPFPAFPGGYLIGGLLLINLICAQVYRFTFTWRKAGIWLTHVGLILLLVGELISGLLQQDYEMTIDEGATVNYSVSERYTELAVTDTTDEKTDQVTAIPEEFLQKNEIVQSPALPFRVVPRAYYPNSNLVMRQNAPSAPPSLATTGFGLQVVAEPVAITYKEGDTNWPTAFVELIAPEGSIGVFLVSTQLPMPQRFDYHDRHYKLSMRFARMYHPFTITLLKFSHDIYPGTDIPKNFSSKIHLATADGIVNRDFLIYMNNPLRYGGLTFYQQKFANEDRTTVLQVVKNPSWLMPYIACSLMALGMVFHFLIHLAGFASRRAKTAAA
jgi:hypothetical protein